MRILAISLLFICSALQLQAACLIKGSNGAPAVGPQDPLFQVLRSESTCPNRVQDLKKLLEQKGLLTAPAMVANRGRNNPELGSFSFFESVTGTVSGAHVGPGEIFFGHFTEVKDHQLALDQVPDKGKLMIELIAWDASKGYYNFYEMIGTGGGVQWFYRGDSADILHDNTFVHRDAPAGSPQFGARLRCSACHSSGGPIMKELSAPHNDWWSQSRPLEFGSHPPSVEVQKWVSGLIDADQFSQNVKAGIERLEASDRYQNLKKSLSLQERLRPLFCENEINLESDSIALSDAAASVKVPSGFLISPMLAEIPLKIKRADYVALLQTHKVSFPESNAPDADHAWLVPVKGFSDHRAVQSLVEDGLIDEEFVRDVLAVDYQIPIFSASRCGLLKLVPERVSAKWQDELVQNLSRSGSAAAEQLKLNLTSPERNQAWRFARFTKYAQTVKNPAVLPTLFQKLLLTRQATFSDEISQNPRGQILEPGFRVIFPEPHP